MLLVVKNLPANAGGLRDVGLIPRLGSPLEESMVTHSSVLAWRIPWTEEPGELQSMVSTKSWTWLNLLPIQRSNWLASWSRRYNLGIQIFFNSFLPILLIKPGFLFHGVCGVIEFGFQLSHVILGSGFLGYAKSISTCLYVFFPLKTLLLLSVLLFCFVFTSWSLLVMLNKDLLTVILVWFWWGPKLIGTRIHWKYWCWNSSTLAPWCEELTHYKRPWCWERLKAGEEDDRGCNGWMASQTRWTWVWASSGSWWWTGKPDMLQSMGLPWVGRDSMTELNWKFVGIFFESSLIQMCVLLFS